MHVSLTIPAGHTTAIVGANACGKSTLLRVLSRLFTSKQGEVLLDGNAIHRLPTRRLAQQLGFLPQSPIAPEGISVLELVSRGRHPHQGLFKRWSASDDAAVAEALAATHMTELAACAVEELSGGQRQRTWIAMAKGQVYAVGPPEQILTEQMVREVFGLESRVIADPVTGKPMMIPLGPHGAGKPTQASHCYMQAQV